ncbi:zinc-binding alcohol dehydrogenase family protein [Parasegetibacter sp. NRK P23]|uniref:zinc-binding alcohol dehydrogenase family protein n=1 Tax=Parasegetibacter sp. NRK P23 TaxID=2942999 RepID=UPI002044551F|nr:zinc-binding alcohol dehydrogenase family protein [Parasegetibacter sp. NRK P23]MCM5526853.1 zinc-binding alcohol dehydrogenase family protein [Parasegetibacter sp. NRK P23]
MKVLYCTTPGKFDYDEKEQPKAAPGYSLLNVKRVGICGTDLHAFEGTQPFFSYPRILGHELACTFVEGAAGFEPGEAVTIIPYFNCGTCVACRRGKGNCCTKMQVCGVHLDGGMAEYLLVPDDKLVHGNGLSLDELALVEPLAIALHGVKRAAVEEGEWVLIMGAGPIGIGIIEFARMYGGNVVVADVNEDRLEWCRKNLGVQHTINPASEELTVKLEQLTNGEMATVVIDATGSNRAIHNGFPCMAHGARYVLVGLQKEAISFSHPEFHKRESTLMSSRNATREDFEEVIDAMKQQKIQPLKWVTHRVNADEIAKEFPGWIDPKNKVIKALTNW